MRKLIALGTLGLVLGLSTPAFAEPEPPKHILTVQGQGQVVTPPDSFVASISVENEAKTPELARSLNASRMAQVIGKVKGLGISHLTLKTTGFNLYPVRDNGKVPRVIGYHVSNRIEARVEDGSTDKLGETAAKVMDAAMNAGANNVDSVNFYLSKNNAAPKEALTLAIQQAKDMANVAAQAAGVTLTGIDSIDPYTQPVAYRSAMLKSGFAEAAAPMAEPTPIETGDMDVTASVTMRFTFK